MERPGWRKAFRYMNNFFMVPLFKLGLGWFIVSPLTGYIMVLKTRGRKSGKVRYAPVNYAISGGSVYCIAGWGRSTHWFANLREYPSVEVLLPGRPLSGIAEEVTDPDEARQALVRVARNAGFALLFDGLNPLTATDEDILAKNEGLPIIRIRVSGVAGGPHDPGGWGWVPPLLVRIAGVLWLVARRRKPGA
jgi:deazaflavin-dependent oxidoreductase (nitroreductase family)